jgi:hypothetical protein
MPGHVKLSDIVDALDMISETRFAYLNRLTGRLVVVTEDALAAAEREDDHAEHPDWEAEEILEAREVLGSSEYLELPTTFDLHEYSIIEEFCLSVEDDELRDELLVAIRGRGAFRCFKDAIRRLGIADDWYAYRSKALAQIAAAWLEDHGIEYDSQGESPAGAPPN